MISTRFGLNIATFAAATLLLAACTDKTPPPADTGMDAPDETVAEAPAPEAVKPAVIKSATEMALEMGATLDGLLAYAGSDRVFFDYDSAELTMEGQAMLAKQAEWLGHFNNVAITVEGHCDERGTREYNLALGERRAVAVKNYLVSLGVSAYQVKTISYGKERPEVVGSGESSWSQNRRGVVVVR